MFEHGFFDAHLFKHGFNHQVGIFQVVVTQRGAEQGHALRVCVFFELAFFDLRFVILLNRGNATVQGLLLCFEQLDRQARIEEVHRNAAAHGARANDGHRLDGAHRGGVGHIGNFGGRALCGEQVAQGTALGRPHQVDEQLALVGHAVGEFFLGGRFDGVHTLRGCGEVFGHALDHVAGELKVGIALRVLAGQIAHFGQRAHIGHLTRQAQGFVHQ